MWDDLWTMVVGAVFIPIVVVFGLFRLAALKRPRTPETCRRARLMNGRRRATYRRRSKRLAMDRDTWLNLSLIWLAALVCGVAYLLLRVWAKAASAGCSVHGTQLMFTFVLFSRNDFHPSA